jgi:hypothetical protein
MTKPIHKKIQILIINTWNKLDSSKTFSIPPQLASIYLVFSLACLTHGRLSLSWRCLLLLQQIAVLSPYVTCKMYLCSFGDTCGHRKCHYKGAGMCPLRRNRKLMGDAIWPYSRKIITNLWLKVSRLINFYTYYFLCIDLLKIGPKRKYLC